MYKLIPVGIPNAFEPLPKPRTTVPDTKHGNILSPISCICVSQIRATK